MSSKILKTVSVLTLVALSGCFEQAKPQPSEHNFYAAPTRSEVFNLRSKCADLASIALAKDIHGPALTVNIVSKYVPETNRCFVELDASPVDSASTSIRETVLDGQTEEILAWFDTSGPVWREESKKTCYITDAGKAMLGEYKSCDEVNEKILDLMTDARRN